MALWRTRRVGASAFIMIATHAKSRKGRAVWTKADPTFSSKKTRKLAGKFSGIWVVNSKRALGIRPATTVSVASDFGFDGFTELRTMNGVTKPTTFSKDQSFGSVHPHFGLDTRSQRGCHSFRRAPRGLR
jgi:hypothetical protein